MSTLPATERHALVREQARTTAGAWVTCASGSMEPTVRVGQRVRVRAACRARAGQVVLFETGDGAGLVLHRVVFAPVWADWFVHVGDAGQRAGVGRHRQVVGVADLPRRRPSARAMWQSGVRVAFAIVGKIHRAAGRARR